MTVHPPRSLFEKQVELTRLLVALYRSMDMHLTLEVIPHFDGRALEVVRNLVEHLREEDAAHPDLVVYIDPAVHEIRKAIAAGKIVGQSPIPRERMIGCTKAFDTQASCTPAAEALQAALPPMERFLKAAREAHEFAEAIRLSLALFDME